VITPTKSQPIFNEDSKIESTDSPAKKSEEQTEKLNEDPDQ
jgi:hypothetical protein